MRALVLGGYGAVGTGVVEELRAHGHVALAAGRDPARADLAMDLRESGLRTYEAALHGIDVVVNAAGVEDPRPVNAAAERGVAFVDVSATAGYLGALERLTPAAPVVLSVGLAPGLTTLLAADVHTARPDAAIDIAVLLGAGDAHGAAATEWVAGLLGRRFADPATGALVRNFTRPRTFELPGHGLRRLPRADFSDQHVLTADLGVPVRTYLGLDSRAATAGLSLLTRLPGSRSLATGVHLPGSDAWVVLATTDEGHGRWAAGRNQSRATAVLAALAAARSVSLAAGVHHLHRVVSLGDLPASAGFGMGAEEIR
jgi:NAD(P)-dependent dehydrogenase (short-subunit alcohol dehydrogenase family)